MRSNMVVCVLFVLILTTSTLITLKAKDVEGKDGTFGGGSGTLVDPYIIEDVWDLQAMEKNLSAHYILKNDIDASETRIWNSGAGFDPIGTYDSDRPSASFSGILNGKNHSISGLFINHTNDFFIGLFGCIGYGGFVIDLHLIALNITGHNYTGGLVGLCNGTVINCSISGNVGGTGICIGGLVGVNSCGVVSKCSVIGIVKGGSYVGGLIGHNNLGSMSFCKSQVIVNGSNIIGGLIGYNGGGSENNSYATGNVIGKEFYIGGTIGFNIGYVNNTYSNCRVQGKGFLGGFIGYDYGIVSNCYWDINTSGLSFSASGIGKTTEEMKIKSTYAIGGWDFESIWCIVDNMTYPFFRWEDIISPIVNSGLDQTVYEGDEVTFDGGNCSDDFGILIYKWTFYDGYPVALYGVRPTYQFNNPGDFVVTLNVSDAADNWNIDSMNVSVIDITPPKANAGIDRIVEEGMLVMFDGSKSTDNVMIVNWTWELSDGTNIILYGVQTTYQFNNLGVFIVTLKVSDNAGNTHNDSLIVRVIDSIKPIAVAGLDQVVKMGTIVHFDGSASYDNEGVVIWTWMFTDEVQIELFGARPTYQFNNPGLFNITLQVTDAEGNWDTDSMTVKVNDSVPPVAKLSLKDTYHYSYGPRKVIVRSGDEIILSANGSFDPVGEIVEYHWEIPPSTTLINGSLSGDKEASEKIIFQFDGNSNHFLNITLWVRDSSGLVSSKDWILLMPDSAPPTLDTYTIYDSRAKTFLEAPYSIDEDVELIFNATRATDNGVIVDHIWSFNDGSGTFNNMSVRHRFEDPGKFNIALLLIDAVGNRMNFENRAIFVRDTTKPIPVLTLSTTEIEMGSEVILDGSLSYDPRTYGDLYVAISNYTWFLHKVGENYTKQVVLDYGKVIDHKFMVPGYWVLNLTIIDENGLIAWTEMTLLIGGPDLQVDAVVFVDPEIKDIRKGDRVKISLIIMNYGMVDILEGMEWELKIDLNGKIIMKESIDAAISAGGIILFNFSYTFETEGTNELMVYLDSTNAVPEIVETNNEFKVIFAVNEQIVGPDWGLIVPFVFLVFVVLPIMLFLILRKKKGPGHDLKLEE